MNDSPPLTPPDWPGDMPGDWPRLEPGWVWLCGAGPGDPGLMTLHGLNALRQADVIVHDALVNPALLDWAPQAERVAAGKRGGRPSPRQSDISLMLVDLARAGRRVLRLKGGDPFMFGRGGEEARLLARHGMPFRIIPGISAGIGGLAYAGIPVTDGGVGQAVTFLSGHDPAGDAPALDWQAISRGSPVLVIYMGVTHAGRIATALMAAGRPGDEPVAVVSNATLPGQKVLTTVLERMAADIAAAAMPAPAIICVGATVPMRHLLDWWQPVAAP